MRLVVQGTLHPRDGATPTHFVIYEYQDGTERAILTLRSMNTGEIIHECMYGDLSLALMFLDNLIDY